MRAYVPHDHGFHERCGFALSVSPHRFHSSVFQSAFYFSLSAKAYIQNCRPWLSCKSAKALHRTNCGTTEFRPKPFPGEGNKRYSRREAQSAVRPINSFGTGVPQTGNHMPAGDRIGFPEGKIRSSDHNLLKPSGKSVSAGRVREYRSMQTQERKNSQTMHPPASADRFPEYIRAAAPCRSVGSRLLSLLSAVFLIFSLYLGVQ